MVKHHKVWLEHHPERSELWFYNMIEQGLVVHHMDGDHGNNHPSNLVLIESSDHEQVHGRLKPFHDNEWSQGTRKERATLGQSAYDMRVTGWLWKDIAKRLGYDDGTRKAPQGFAVNVAKAYALYHARQWPIPHIAECTCTRCTGKFTGKAS